jgi:ribonuclease R
VLEQSDKKDGAGALPSRAEVIAFVKRERALAEKAGSAPLKIGKREIARAFGVRGADRIALKRLIRELEDEGALERRRKTLHVAGRLPPMVLVDVQRRDDDGDLIAAPVEWDEEAHGAAPQILVHGGAGRRGSREPAPGVGDRALMRVALIREPGDGPAYAGRVVKILDRAKSRALGVFRADPDGGGRIVSVDKKAAGREIWIPPGAEQSAEDGELVSVDVASQTRLGRPAGKVVERLGSVGSERGISLIALKRHGCPDAFSAAALAQARDLRPTGLEGREDWRALPLVTIDPPDARDHDDAVHAIPDPDPANEGGHILVVAIADVAAYVRPDSPLDREALDRGNSIYFPGRVVPMLPERLSNDLCSLRAQEDRPALAARMVIDRHGRKLRHTFHRVMMRSAAKLSYDEAQAAIEGSGSVPDGLLRGVLRPLWAAYESLKTARDQRAPLALDLPERKILLREDGSIDRVVTPERLDAHRLIEEFMILANVAAAETLEDRRQPLIYRAHDEPTVEKINDLSDFLGTLGVKLAKGQALRPAQFNGILARVAGSANEALVNEAVLRAQAQAEYTARNYGHFGLHLRRYAHFTSPIRRYADLVVHRALIAALHLGERGGPSMEPGWLDDVAARISAAERRAVAAERETVDRLVAFWLADKIGAEFSGRISGVVKPGLFVKLDHTGADGFVPAATLGADYFRFEEKRRALVGTRTRESFRLGDGVRVRLVEAAPFAGALRFEIVRAGASGDRAVLARDRSSTGREGAPAPWKKLRKSGR